MEHKAKVEGFKAIVYIEQFDSVKICVSCCVAVIPPSEF